MPVGRSRHCGVHSGAEAGRRQLSTPTVGHEAPEEGSTEREEVGAQSLLRCSSLLVSLHFGCSCLAHTFLGIRMELKWQSGEPGVMPTGSGSWWAAGL